MCPPLPDSASSAARPYHHGDLRRALLDAGVEMLRQEGADGLSLRELARRVGVSHGAPRRHFADRQALLMALGQEGFERLGGELAAAIENAGRGFRARLEATARAYVRFATEDAALLELMFAGKHQPGGEQLDQVAERAFEAMLELIGQGQREGRLRGGDPTRVGLVLFATLQGIAALMSSAMVEASQAEQLIGDAIRSFLQGSGPAPRVPARARR